jgi:ABC transporter substrate binding protein
MERRTFMALVSGGLLAMPLAARAQQTGKLPRVGWLSPGSAASDQTFLASFRDALRELGLVVGQNIVIESRWAEGRFERLPDLAADLVRLKVDVIVTVVTQASLAAKRATRTIPIVMVGVGDPLGSGLVAGLARPGENVTGPSSMLADVSGKQLALLKETVPKASPVAVALESGQSSLAGGSIERDGGRRPGTGAAAPTPGGAGSRRTRGGIRGDDQRARRRPLCPSGHYIRSSRTTDRRPRGKAPPACGVRVQGTYGGRWPHVLCGKLRRHVPARCRLCGQDS